jgi:hypothetical protein
MGRIKDLVIELQNEYGYDLENLPEGFSMDDYLEMKSKEINPLTTSIQYTEQLFCEQVNKK